MVKVDRKSPFLNEANIVIHLAPYYGNINYLEEVPVYFRSWYLQQERFHSAHLLLNEIRKRLRKSKCEMFNRKTYTVSSIPSEDEILFSTSTKTLAVNIGNVMMMPTTYE